MSEATQEAAQEEQEVQPGEIDPKTGKKKRKKRTPKPEMPAELAVDDDGNTILDGEGLFTQVPTNWNRKFRPLKRKQFADEATYLDFKAFNLEKSIKKTLDNINSLRKEAEMIREHGDATLIRKMRKAERMRASLAALEEELAAEGLNKPEI